MQKSLLGLMFALAAVPAWAADPPPSGENTPAQSQAAAAQQLAALCAKVPCRKVTRQVVLRMQDGSSFQISTRPLPYLDDRGNLVLFAGESVTLTYAAEDQKLEHPLLTAIGDPAGAVELPPPTAKAALTFDFQQMDGKPDMMLTVTNTSGATVKYDVATFGPIRPRVALGAGEAPPALCCRPRAALPVFWASSIGRIRW